MNSYIDCRRHGLMTSFKNFEEFTDNFVDVLELFHDQMESFLSFELDVSYNSPNSFDERNEANAINRQGLMNILNVAIRMNKSDHTITSFEYLKNEGERLLLESLDELEVAFTHPMAKKTDCNHIFLNFVPAVNMDPNKIADDNRHSPYWREEKTLLFVYAFPMMLVTTLIWARTRSTSRVACIYSIHDQGFYGNEESRAQAVDTSFVYDFPDIFKMGLREIWKDYHALQNNLNPAFRSDSEIFSCTELVLDSNEMKVIEQKRYPGENDIGMVAWRMTLKTPEYPTEGRDIIVIANDITHQIGSFGPKEDKFIL
ncbi:ACACA [Lepeophtheirus salmonis]|uniref:ACACA n=1 Tax=Lepeophtheirus salmonis TaxID=72036 RepID=A0A7R8D979_LEPSM|nr:ACACA [Lepeophtheirus salmonis]CAF3042909.1 ACACA [Lepeophtheirus salmonis]